MVSSLLTGVDNRACTLPDDAFRTEEIALNSTEAVSIRETRGN
jgi:hypothetical protein